MDKDDELAKYQQDVQGAIANICELAAKKQWSYLVLFGACQAFVGSSRAVIDSGLAKEWDTTQSGDIRAIRQDD